MEVWRRRGRCGRKRAGRGEGSFEQGWLPCAVPQRGSCVEETEVKRDDGAQRKSYFLDGVA